MVLTAGIAATSSAIAGDLYVVPGISVRATADTAQEAQLQARAEGRARAFRKLMQRLTPREYWNHLPDASPEQLESYEASLDVVKEHTNRNLYIATLDFRFSPTAVRGFLKTANIPFSESQARPAVLLPVLEADGQRLLWEETNAWAAAWVKRRLTHELVPLEFALGDLQDIGAVDAARAVAASWQDLQSIARRYRVGEVIVAVAVLQPGNQQDTLYVRADRVGPQSSSRTEAVVTGAKGDRTDLYARAVEAVVDKFNDAWKRNTLVQYGIEREIDVTVRFSGLADWVRVRNSLSQVATVVETRTVALSPGGAEIVLRFAGTPDQLALNLKQRNLYLAAMDGRWEMGLGRSPVSDQDLSYGELPPIRVINPNTSGYGSGQGGNGDPSMQYRAPQPGDPAGSGRQPRPQQPAPN